MYTKTLFGNVKRTVIRLDLVAFMQDIFNIKYSKTRKSDGN